MTMTNNFCENYCRFPAMVENKEELNKVCSDCLMKGKEESDSKRSESSEKEQTNGDFTNEEIALVFLSVAIATFKNHLGDKAHKAPAVIESTMQTLKLALIFFCVVPLDKREELKEVYYKALKPIFDKTGASI